VFRFLKASDSVGGAETMRRDPGSTYDAGFTLIELLIAMTIIALIAAFATPRLLRARMNASESAAISAMRSIGTAEEMYASACGQGGFASSLMVLGVPPAGTTAAFLSEDMTVAVTALRDGYSFTVTPGANAVNGPNDCNGTATTSAYYGSAIPLTFGTTGTRSFATSPAHTIWELTGGQAPSEPFGAPATPIQ
jgi:prepilin-type N-terminal cleavage/methylation domain-containing protein